MARWGSVQRLESVSERIRSHSAIVEHARWYPMRNIATEIPPGPSSGQNKTIDIANLEETIKCYLTDALIAATSPAAFVQVSSSSCSGTLSETIPPPT